MVEDGYRKFESRGGGQQEDKERPQVPEHQAARGTGKIRERELR